MFVCLDCGYLFEEPESYFEDHGLSSPPYEEICGCPSCCGEYVETMKCDCCDDWITGEYAKLSDGTLVCDDCYVIRDISNEW